MHVVNEDYTRVLAVPCDMFIAGYGTKHTNALRLWDAKSPTPIDMGLFSRGDYLKAGEEKAMAEVIAKVLYPEDNHYEGKSLRLRQQYFFVSATVQSIVRKHIQAYGTLTNFHEKNIIQINDTHPTLVIPELMRILMDDAGLDWDTAWHITSNSVAYTNHTVLAEALERWPQALMQTLLPRIWQIICEIARRWQEKPSPPVRSRMSLSRPGLISASQRRWSMPLVTFLNRHLRRPGQAAPRVQAPAAQRAAHHPHLPPAPGQSQPGHPSPHLYFRRQGRARLRRGQADHPAHQLPGGPDQQRSRLQG